MPNDEHGNEFNEPDQPSYTTAGHPRTSALAVNFDLHSLGTGLLSLIVTALGIWVWNTNTAITRMEVGQSQMEAKIDIMYDRLVVNPK